MEEILKKYDEELLLRVRVRETQTEIVVKRPKHDSNPFGFYSQMWLFTDDGDIYHEDEVELIEIIKNGEE